MMRERSTAPDRSGAQGPSSDAAARAPLDGMTRAQARALSRCAPLSPAEFAARRRVAEKGLVTLREVIDTTRAGEAGRARQR